MHRIPKHRKPNRVIEIIEAVAMIGAAFVTFIWWIIDVKDNDTCQ